jgi:glucokinase
MTAKSYTIGIDIGGTNIKFGIFDQAGRCIEKLKIATVASQHSDSILSSIVEQVPVILQKAGLSLAQIASVGLGVPGTVDDKTGVAILAPNIFWRNVEVRKVIQHHIDIPVHLAQDSRAAAWGELLRGAGKGMKQIVSITLGTGIGCGLIIDGKIFHGSLNTAGEFGHQIVEVNGLPCNCGRHGCLEVYAGGPALLKQTLAIKDVDKMTGKPSDKIEVLDLFQLAQKGHAMALSITESLVRYLGIGMVNLINLMSPELIIISGGISNAPDELLLQPLSKFIKERAYAGASNAVKVVKSTLGDEAPLIGASLLHLA